MISRPKKSPGRTEGEGVDGCRYDDGDGGVGKEKTNTDGVVASKDD